jgi:hypothetical protein
MQITQEDKQKVIDALASNPQVNTHPMSYADLLVKTGFKTGKLNAVKDALLGEDRIWQARDEESDRRVIYLLVADKRQQIIDLIKRSWMDSSFRRMSVTWEFEHYTKMPACQVNALLIRLHEEGWLDIESIDVEPSQRLLDVIMQEEEVKRSTIVDT